jgi:hypothetical protein
LSQLGVEHTSQSFFNKLEKNNTIIDKWFVCQEEEVDQLCRCIEERMTVKFEEVRVDFMEVAESLQAQYEGAVSKIMELKESLAILWIGHFAQAATISSLQIHLSRVEDMVMEEVELVAGLSSSSLSIEPAENIVTIPVLAPGIIIHSLVSIMGVLLRNSFLPFSII